MKSRLNPRRVRARSHEAGSAYLMALFAILMLIIAATAIVQRLSIDGRREREAEMIWRGEQYERAIKLYFRKTGHYPQTMDDLVKGMPQLHFLRQAYKDPINKTDGAWRYIYVNAAGQIIGSTRYASLQQMAILESGALQNLAPGQQPGQAGVSASSLANPGFSNMFGGLNSSSSGPLPTASTGSNPNDPSQNPQQNPPQDSSGSNPPPPQQNTQTSQPSQSAFGLPGQPALSGSSSGLQLQNPILAQKPTGPVDGPVLGGFLVGVASKVDAPSLKVLHGGKKYLDWEFIWNPLLEQARATQQVLGGGAGAGQPGLGLPIANPFGGSTNNPFGGGPGGPGQQPTYPQTPLPNPIPVPPDINNIQQ